MIDEDLKAKELYAIDTFEDVLCHRQEARPNEFSRSQGLISPKWLKTWFTSHPDTSHHHTTVNGETNTMSSNLGGAV